MKIAAWSLVSEMQEQSCPASFAQVSLHPEKSSLCLVVCLEKPWAVRNSLEVQAQTNHRHPVVKPSPQDCWAPMEAELLTAEILPKLAFSPGQSCRCTTAVESLHVSLIVHPFHCNRSEAATQEPLSTCKYCF